MFFFVIFIAFFQTIYYNVINNSGQQNNIRQTVKACFLRAVLISFYWTNVQSEEIRRIFEPVLNISNSQTYKTDRESLLSKGP